MARIIEAHNGYFLRHAHASFGECPQRTQGKIVVTGKYGCERGVLLEELQRCFVSGLHPVGDSDAWTGGEVMVKQKFLPFFMARQSVKLVEWTADFGNVTMPQRQQMFH